MASPCLHSLLCKHIASRYALCPSKQPRRGPFYLPPNRQYENIVGIIRTYVGKRCEAARNILLTMAIRKVDKSVRNCPVWQTSSLITLGCRVSRRKFSVIALDRVTRENIEAGGRSGSAFSRPPRRCAVAAKCQEKQCRPGNTWSVPGIDTRLASR